MGNDDYTYRPAILWETSITQIRYFLGNGRALFETIVY